MIDAFFSWLSIALHTLGCFAALAIAVVLVLAYVPGAFELCVAVAQRWLNGGRG